MKNNQLTDNGEAIFPWLIFKLNEGYFTINSELVSGIMTIPNEIVSMPKTPSYIRGVFELRNKIISLVDLRELFGFPSLITEYNEFAEMLEQRKQDHLNWVKELERSVEEDVPFLLTTDPHQCAFGKWYDNYTSKSHTINHHLNKIKEPHAKLHNAALEVENCKRDCDHCQRKECLKSVFKRLSKEYVPQIVSLIDETKELFREGFREMVVIMDKNGQSFGVITDEIISVEELSKPESSICEDTIDASKFISEIRKSTMIDKNIMVINNDILINAINNGM